MTIAATMTMTFAAASTATIDATDDHDRCNFDNGQCYLLNHDDRYQLDDDK